MRLLPKDPHIGWTPYAWLIYLLGFLAEPFWRREPAWEVGATLVAVATFLVLYFYGFWQARESWRLRAVAAAIVLLGVVCVPFSPNAVVFFIYGASFFGFVAPKRTAILCIVGVALSVVVVGWVLGTAPWFFATGGVFSLLIGGINVHAAEVREQGDKLLASQAEIERLAKAAERERIGRDLHDLLGHTLSLITLKAELAGKLLDRDPARAGAEVREVERISREALREVREALSGYRSDGLDAELARARLALESSGIACEYFLTPLDLDPKRETALALALREAVTNVVRHAGATTCRIALERSGDGVTLEVRDDGRGGAAAEGMGLSSMRSRIEGLGGRCERTVEGGTTLRLTLPGREPAARAPESRPLPSLA